MMIFIDGENLVHRYQSMVSKGWEPGTDIVHIPDVLVWRESATHLVGAHVVLRANLYTYAIGDDIALHTLNEQIRALRLMQHMSAAIRPTLSPVVFKKAKRTKAKGVDIQLTVDVLSHVYQNNVDTVYLLSGDGDYRPLIEEVLRNGKQVYLSAFSDGLNPSLPHLVDSFYLLDDTFFKPKP